MTNITRSRHRVLEYLLQKFLWCILLMLPLFASSLCFGQFTSTQHHQPTGFYMTKVVSDTAINIGQPFSYTVFFNIPVGTTSLTLTDAIPAPLTILNTSFSLPSNASCTYSPTAPLNVSGNTVTMSLTNIPACFSGVGSFEITVQFPNGTTCNGTSVINRVCATGKVNGIDILQGGLPLCLDERGVKTVAIANNPWKVKKLPILSSYNSTTGCWQTADSIVKWGIRVYRDNPNIEGNLNVVNATVTDVLPTGATLVSSTCGATQSGNTITWTVGTLNATLPVWYYDCEFVVRYPRALYPFGTTVSNFALLNGTLGSAASPCGNLTVSSDTTCVNIVSSTPTSGYVQKNFYSATNQAGCFAQYELFFCNRGVSTIQSFTGQDILPASIAPTATFEGTTATTITLNGMIATLQNGIVTVTGTTSLAVGECRSVTINFTIPQVPAGTVISNTMSMTYGTPPQTAQTTTSFTVRENKPIPCLFKEVTCKNPANQVDYNLGSVLRYRLRIQNIGGGALTGVTLTDVLNSNLEYIGNPSYYIGTSYATTPHCVGGTAPNQWSGVTLNYYSATNTVTATLPQIASQVCDVKASPSCGAYGTAGLSYYFIEFDVRVRESSALGNIPHVFSVSGGNLGYELFSDTAFVLVVGNPVLSVAKSVRKSAAQPYSTSTGVNSGSTIQFRLQSTIPAGAPFLHDIHFVDLLPKNDGPNDKFITQPCGNRGSQFDITWGNNMLPTSTTGITRWYTDISSMPSYLNFAGYGSPIQSGPGVFTSGQQTCGASTSWYDQTVGNTTNNTPMPSTGVKYIGFHLGTGARTGTQTIDFDAKVANTATNGQTACNTFVAGGWAQFLINSSAVNFQRVISPESNTACVTIADSNKCLNVKRDSTKVTVGGWVNGSCTNNVTATLTNPNATATTYTVIPPTGTIVTPSSVTINANATMQQIFTVTLLIPPPQNVCIRFSISPNQPPCDSVCFTTLACQTVPSCNNLLVSLNNQAATCAGLDGNGNRMYSVTMTGTNSNGPVTIQFPTTQIGNASISPATVAINSNGTFTANFTYTDLIPVTTSPFVTVTYNIINSLGQSVTCTSILDLPNCTPPPNPCCQNFVKRVQYTQAQVGVPPNGLVNSGNIDLGATLFAGPNPIQKFTATIVSAQTRMVRRVGLTSPVLVPLPGQQGQWRRTFGDIRPVSGSAGTLVTSPATLISMTIPQTNGSMPVTGQFPNRVREATWQSPVCRDWRNGIPMRLLMKFPEPMANATQPADRFEQLSFSVKFSFTDCNCNTCDTVIHFLVARRRIQGPFSGNDGFTSIQPSKTGNQVQGIQGAIPAQTSIVMESDSKGKLWIINPNTPDNTITVKGVEIVSEIAEIISLQNGSTAGFTDKTIGVISTNVKPGTNGEIDMVMKPISGLSVYKFDVRFQYVDSTSDEIQYSDVYSMTARVPGFTPDVMDIDKTTKPANVRTYSVFFRNTNGLKENVSRIRVRTSGKQRILAVGPQSEQGNIAILTPVTKQSGTIVLTPLDEPADPVAPDSSVKPIYITLSGVDSDTIRLNYDALDETNSVISSGSFLLSDPISKVDDERGDGNMGISILTLPNPATTSATISITLEKDISNVTVKIVDMLGREVLNVTNNSLLFQGSHVFSADLSLLASGSYFIILNAEQGRATQPLNIVR